jgi:hypothetical protein
MTHEKIDSGLIIHILMQTNMIKDHGTDIPFDEVKKAALAGKFIECLDNRLNCEMSALNNHAEWKSRINETIKLVATGKDGRERRKMGVTTSGACLANAYALELLCWNDHVDCSGLM